jgi:N-acetylglucosaminyl-diphospho-decaprenol L-rhamnosyltransferase
MRQSAIVLNHSEGGFSLLPIPIVIVAFRNSGDVVDCLESLGQSNPEPSFDVYLCENGGHMAFAELCSRISAPDGPCIPSKQSAPCATEGFRAVESFMLKGVGAKVFVGDAGDNLGYGGAVNCWLRPLMGADEWPGALVLNPDMTLAPDALSAVVRYSNDRKGMVTGRIVRAENPARIHTRGLKWRRMLASVAAVGRAEPFDSPAPAEIVERAIDAPSGSFVYVTRACLQKIGLMEERYFLYFEDLDWGLRAKRMGEIGYAFDAVVYHKGGTTIGSGPKHTISEFATYLNFRNRVLFVNSHFPAWLFWTVAISLVRALEFGARGRMGNMRAAARGVVDGILRRDGRPDDVLRRHLVQKATN